MKVSILALCTMITAVLTSPADEQQEADLVDQEEILKELVRDQEEILEERQQAEIRNQEEILEESQQVEIRDQEEIFEESQQVVRGQEEILEQQQVKIRDQEEILEKLQQIELDKEEILVEFQQAELKEQETSMVKQQLCVHRLRISNKKMSTLPKDLLVTAHRKRHNKTHKSIRIRRSRSGKKHVQAKRHHPYYHAIVQQLYSPVCNHGYMQTTHT